MSNEREAIVIDPRRDCGVYIRLAEECTKIRCILEKAGFRDISNVLSEQTVRKRFEYLSKIENCKNE